MPVQSCLRTGCRLFLTSSWKLPFKNSVAPKGILQTIVRNMSEKRTLNIRDGFYIRRILFDDLYFYTMLGAVPLGLVILYSNLFIGQAELKDIPEGYEPKHWEYYKGPIQRWFARNVYDSMEKVYEKNMHFIAEKSEIQKQKDLTVKVKKLMAANQDYRGWYFRSVSDAPEKARIRDPWKGTNRYGDATGMTFDTSTVHDR